jgi:hypothetical protein
MWYAVAARSSQSSFPRTFFVLSSKLGCIIRKSRPQSSKKAKFSTAFFRICRNIYSQGCFSRPSGLGGVCYITLTIPPSTRMACPVT